MFSSIKNSKKNYSKFRVKEHFSFQPLRTIRPLHLCFTKPWKMLWLWLIFSRRWEKEKEYEWRMDPTNSVELQSCLFYCILFLTLHFYLNLENYFSNWILAFIFKYWFFHIFKSNRLALCKFCKIQKSTHKEMFNKSDYILLH